MGTRLAMQLTQAGRRSRFWQNVVTKRPLADPPPTFINCAVVRGVKPAAEVLAVQTILGSAQLLESSDEHAAALRAQVTSPGGTTAAGLRALEAGGFRAAILDAVSTATARSRELGQ